MHPYGSASSVIETAKFSPDLLEAIDLAHLRGTFGVREGSGARIGLTDADLLLGLFLAEDGKAHEVLAGLGVGEEALRQAVRGAKADPDTKISPEGLMLEAVLHMAAARATSSGYGQVGGEFLLHAVTTCHGRTPAKLALEQLNLKPQQVRNQVDAVSPSRHGMAVGL